jgi:hypothetical protein
VKFEDHDKVKEKAMGQLVLVKEKKRKQDYNQQEGTIEIGMENKG